MPELPEVEVMRRGLSAHLDGRRITRCAARRPDLRFPLPKDFAARLTERQVMRVTRRGKYLLIHLDKDMVWLVHLGMSGRFSDDDAPHSHIALALDDGTALFYADPRRFGYMDLLATAEAAGSKYLAALGAEPLGNEFSSAYLAEKLRARRAPIKAALLDQKIIAGLGNIYVCEALFRARIAPQRLACNLRPKEIAALARAIPPLLRAAIAAGGATLRDFAALTGQKGQSQDAFEVYGHAGDTCPRARCNGKVERVIQSGRSSFYCAHCQK